MQNVLLVIQLLVAIAMIAVILLQKTAADGGGLAGGGGGGTMGGLFTARGSANILTRTTAILATLFIVICLALGAMASRQHDSSSAVDQIQQTSVPAEQSQPAQDGSLAPEVPLAE
ncbi:MAG: preprotein translocase subunit SecG [Alphaproteobacteria bacterium]|nr:preprotein translocase subunit SecG [Alphaproteobacteria bacterium]